MDYNDQVLALDMDNLSQEEHDWLHELRNRAMLEWGRVYMSRRGIPMRNEVDYGSITRAQMNESKEKEGYGTTHREEMMRSMEYPAKPQTPLQGKREGFLRVPVMDRRAPGLLMKLRRFWYHVNEDVGMFLWLVVGFMVAAGLWWVYGGITR